MEPRHVYVVENDSSLYYMHMFTPSMPVNFASLRKQAEELGLFKRQPAYYTWKAVQLILMLTVAVGVLFFLNSLWTRLIAAAFLAFTFGQVGLLFHDAGHRQIFSKGKPNNFVGHLCGFVLGASLNAWMDKHNAHHAHPNREDHDPDIDFPFIAFSPEQAMEKKNPILKWTTRNQALLFFPFLTLVAFSLRTTNLRYLWRSRKELRRIWPDALACLGNMFLFLLLVFGTMPFWHGVLFLVVHQLTFGFYLGLVFAPNHKGMEMIGKDQQIDFFTEQVITSRNVRSHPLIDFWYGGLNYQIEHHLFPNMPRNKLAAANKIVQEFCAKHGVPYHETGILRSYYEILRSLHEIGKLLRRKTAMA